VVRGVGIGRKSRVNRRPARAVGQVGQPFGELGPVGRGAQADRHRRAGSQGEADRNDARLHAAGASMLMLLMLPFSATN